MLKKVMIGMAFVMATLTFFGGTVSRAKTAKDTSAFEFYIRDEGNNTCRISGICIKREKGASELRIPDTINGKTVVSIGEGEMLRDGENQEWNAFFMYDDPDDFGWIPKQGMEGQVQRAQKIKKIILPDTIKEIRDYAFSGLRGLKSIELPESLTTIGKGAFQYTSIRKMHFPSNLTAIGEGLFYYKARIKDINIPAKLKKGVADLARTTVSWKRFAVSKKNPYYKVKKGLLLSKDRKTLYATITPNKNIRIPDSVKTITERAFWDKSLKSVYLGAGVREIQLHALSTKTKCKVTLSPKNSYLAQSRMCIYHKKKQELLVAIPKRYYARTSAKIKKHKLYYLRIPRKVKKLGNTMSTVGCVSIRRLYYPKGIEKITLWDRTNVMYRGLGVDGECSYIEY